jgi:DNA-binding NarL/FixJ family response regulator
MPPLRILVADDHDVVRTGLRTLLESRKGWLVCAEATNGRDAVEKARECKPDVAVLDIGMPLLNGVEATRQIRKLSPATEILILTMHDSEMMIQSVLEAGARGYIVKDDAGRNLLAAVDAVRRRKPFLSSRVSDTAARVTPTDSSRMERTARQLTPREREIVQLLAEGKSNKEIATFLNISVKTAETHRANIMLKLNFHSVTELVRYAVKNKIIQP